MMLLLLFCFFDRFLKEIATSVKFVLVPGFRRRIHTQKKQKIRRKHDDRTGTLGWCCFSSSSSSSSVLIISQLNSEYMSE